MAGAGAGAGVVGVGATGAGVVGVRGVVEVFGSARWEILVPALAAGAMTLGLPEKACISVRPSKNRMIKATIITTIDEIFRNIGAPYFLN